MTDRAILHFRDLVAGAFGLAFDESKHAYLGEVLKRRADALKMPVDSYLALFEAGILEGEQDALTAELTIGETYFFRNRDQFNALRETVVPSRMRARGTSRHLRFLSAGCASGEEAYSIAMTLAESVQAPPWKVEIRAIDVNAAALRRAAEARYTTWALRDTPEESRERWFMRQGREFILAPEVCAAVRFARGNLSRDDRENLPAGYYDAIFCRNVLMYFTPSVLQAAVRRLTAALAPGGFLFLGSAETLRGLSQDYHLVHTHGTFYYRRKEEGEADADPPLYVSAGATALRPLPANDAAVEMDPDWYEAIGSASRRVATLTAAPVARRAVPVAMPAPSVAPAQWSLAQSLDLLQRERFGEALTVIEALPSEAHADRDVLLLQAVLLVNSGQPAAAGEVCRRLLAEDELNAGANYVLALCFEGAGNRDIAAHHHNVACYLDPEFAMPRLHLGLMARRAGDLDAARRELEKALALLRREDASRLILFGGGFTRDGLIALADAELQARGRPGMMDLEKAVATRVADLRHAFDSAFAAPTETAADTSSDLIAIELGDDPHALRISDIAGLYADVRVTPCPSPMRVALRPRRVPRRSHARLRPRRAGRLRRSEAVLAGLSSLRARASRLPLMPLKATSASIRAPSPRTKTPPLPATSARWRTPTVACGRSWIFPAVVELIRKQIPENSPQPRSDGHVRHLDVRQKIAAGFAHSRCVRWSRSSRWRIFPPRPDREQQRRRSHLSGAI